MKPKKSDLLVDVVEHIDIKKHNVVPLVEAMSKMAFSARDLGRAAPHAAPGARPARQEAALLRLASRPVPVRVGAESALDHRSGRLAGAARFAGG